MHEVELVPEAKAEGSNSREALSLLMNVGLKQILMTCSIAEGPNSTIIRFQSFKIGQTFTNDK